MILLKGGTHGRPSCRRIDLQGLLPALPADPDDHEAALLVAVPLMLGTGIGSEIRQPLGYAIVGGLAVSQELTLYTTPVIYIYFDKLQTWMSRRRGCKRPVNLRRTPSSPNDWHRLRCS